MCGLCEFKVYFRPFFTVRCIAACVLSLSPVLFYLHIHKHTHAQMQSVCLAMAGTSASMSFESFVLGHHEYYRSWMPVNGELLRVK